jgi:hypothetical protein
MGGRPLYRGPCIRSSTTTRPQKVWVAGDAPILQGQWLRGVYWQSADKGSGMRVERVKVDGPPVHVLDNQARSMCNATSTQSNGEFARNYQPCPTGGPWSNEWDLDTSTLSDGTHNLQVCTQDYGKNPVSPTTRRLTIPPRAA